MVRWTGDRVITVLVGLLAVLVMLFFGLRRKDVYAIGQEVPIRSGYLIDMSYMEPRNAVCYIVRLTSDGCPHCRADQSQYARILTAGRRAGCSLVAIGPQVGDVEIKTNSDVLQLQYVDFRLGRALVPIEVPQTFLLNRGGRLIWVHRGELRERDAATAVQYLARLE